MSRPGLAAAVVGAGLTGPLAALYLARAGHRVEVFERRSDPRLTPPENRRSIHLTLSGRGIAVLSELDLAEPVLARGVPVRGRRVHLHRGGERFHPYGSRPEHRLWSLDRHDINEVLLDRAEADPGVTLHFDRELVGFDRDRGACRLRASDGTLEERTFDLVVGADGAFSDLRRHLHHGLRADFEREYLDWGYRELEIPAHDGSPRLPTDCLHLWPRGEAMLLALPKSDGAFNCIAVLPFEGATGLDRLSDRLAVERLFATWFPDFLALCPDAPERFRVSPTSNFVTLRTSPWSHGHRTVLVGDAAHAAYPFYGQGMISGFEDCSVLARCLAEVDAGDADDRSRALARYEALRKPNTDALADLSRDNFVELSDRSRRPGPTLRRHWERFLSTLLPGFFVPLYTLVAHTRVPYREAVERARRRSRLAALAGAGLLAMGALPLFATGRSTNP